MFAWRTSHADMIRADTQVHVHGVVDGTIRGAHDLEAEIICLLDVCDGDDPRSRLIALRHVVLCVRRPFAPSISLRS